MKKLVLSIGCTVAVAGAAFAQGTVNWVAPAGNVIGQQNGTAYSSFVPTGTQALVGGDVNTVGSGTSQYYYELLVSSTVSAVPTTVAGLSAWSDTGLEAENATSANGRLQMLGSSSQAVASNWASGVTEDAVLVAWSGNLGTTWSAALSQLNNWTADQANYTGANTAFFGVSILGDLAAQSGNPGVTVFGTGPGQIQNPAGSTLQMNQLGVVVPEPGTIALAAIGGASMLMLRRKK